MGLQALRLSNCAEKLEEIGMAGLVALRSVPFHYRPCPQPAAGALERFLRALDLLLEWLLVAAQRRSWCALTTLLDHG